MRAPGRMRSQKEDELGRRGRREEWGPVALNWAVKRARELHPLPSEQIQRGLGDAQTPGNVTINQSAGASREEQGPNPLHLYSPQENIQRKGKTRGP